MVVLKVLSGVIKVFHAILIGALWFSPFYILNPYVLVGAIAFQTLILLQFEYLDNRCVLTMLEYYLAGKKVNFKNSNPSSSFNEYISMLFGKKHMTNLNMYIPYFVIFANCLKLAFVI